MSSTDHKSLQRSQQNDTEGDLNETIVPNIELMEILIHAAFEELRSA